MSAARGAPMSDEIERLRQLARTARLLLAHAKTVADGEEQWSTWQPGWSRAVGEWFADADKAGCLAFDVRCGRCGSSVITSFGPEPATRCASSGPWCLAHPLPGRDDTPRHTVEVFDLLPGGEIRERVPPDRPAHLQP